MTRNAPQLIGLSGYARSGKDTFAAALVEGRSYEQRSFAEPIKNMLYAQNPIVLSSGVRIQEVVDVIGWERAKSVPEVRRLLQALGTDAGRNILGADIWVDAAMRDIEVVGGSRVLKVGVQVVFADVRFRNEALAIQARGGIVVRIERPGVLALNDHPSETAMDDCTYDYVIHNDGPISQLRQKAFDMIDKERGTYVWPHMQTERRSQMFPPHVVTERTNTADFRVDL